MLSQKSRYALRALLVLCEQPDTKPAQSADIAAAAMVPRKFLEQILLQLKRSGLVYSQRGKFGGYRLGRPPSGISFAEVIRAIDGPLALAPCASRTAYRKCDDCIDEETCAIRRVLLDVRDATAHVLESRTLAQVMGEQGKAGRLLGPERGDGVAPAGPAEG